MVSPSVSAKDSYLLLKTAILSVMKELNLMRAMLTAIMQKIMKLQER